MHILIGIMNNLFEKEAIDEIRGRIEQLNNDSLALWGKMNVAQMLAHCSGALDMASGNINPSRLLIGKIIGSLFKPTYYNEKPFSKDSPTDKLIVITDERNFNLEKDKLLETIDNFHKGGEEQCTSHPHPFFGKLSASQWSIGMYKHLDHHLRQFGV